MDQNETMNNGTEFTDNIHSLNQMAVWEEKIGFDYLDLWAVKAKATAHLDVTKPHHIGMGG